MASLDRLDAGAHTARVSAAEQDRLHREAREDAARRYLLTRGLDDVAEILGLTEPAVPVKRSRSRAGGSRRAA
ncbi:hypothetical protein [Micromonospora sp. HUAS LYJ1]|uniref:hypothetical protein n=1 Tax=Micromonospora sp. HUAS LYJ1 TaxID=3061626 RepID=UPI0026736B25|nr:hypothetical protein [Micromonospora sp. HUAS LYJ1]WKU07976.1 hypothetical protein Q2K16_13585 [Micromonospora sp. HUAS LYJ1]